MIPKFIFQSCENLVKKPWGGSYIGNLKGVNIEGIGEAWEFSAHPSRPSIVLGMRFDELVKKYKKEILGNLKCDYFPLLVKIIDANENLSVQVHPSEEQAKMLKENDHGKEEAWVVIDATPDAKIYLGFKENVNPELFIRELKQGVDITTYLNEIKVKRNDAFFIPSGTIHALGKGVRVLEVSTNSNITYRVYDYGRGREIHIDKAIKVLNFKITNISKLKPKMMDGYVRLVDTPFFIVDKILDSIEISKESFHIILCLSGEIMLRSVSESVKVKKGKSVLVPAITEKYTIEIGANSEVYVVSPSIDSCF
ncbi:MAG TPA: mannose-6-phosphate isomerase [Archaeoglobus profundus]|nr:mannose-6-phosphate isomerase [Archaeoglobus profundus]